MTDRTNKEIFAYALIIIHWHCTKRQKVQLKVQKVRLLNNATAILFPLAYRNSQDYEISESNNILNNP